MPPALPDHPLSDRELEDLLPLAKRQLRRARRALRVALPAAARAGRSRAIVTRVAALPEVQAAGSVALFHPIEERAEVDLRELHEALRARGVLVYYPSLDGDSPVLRRVDGLSELEELGHGYLEPPPSAELAPAGGIDVVVVPALAVSTSGHRLGYGAGYYDTLLPRLRPRATSVVVAYDFELVAELPVEPWDVACDVVVTDEREIRPTRP